MVRKFFLFSIMLVLLALTGATGFYLGKTSQKTTLPEEIIATSPSPIQEATFCTMDAKVCPDGSSVGRIPPSCEFAPCPNTGKTTDDLTWKKDVTNVIANVMGEKRDYMFSVRYPENWNFSKMAASQSINNLVQNCANYTILSPDGTKADINLTCSSYIGKKARLPQNYEVIKDLGLTGNDATQQYLIRYSSGTNMFRYGTISTRGAQTLDQVTEMNSSVFVTYAPDDFYFIPVTVTVESKTPEDMMVVDRIVSELSLSR